MSESLHLRAGQIYWGGIVLESSLVGVAAIVGLLTLGEPFPFEIRFDGQGVWQGLLATVPIAAYMLFSLSPAASSFPSLRQIYDILKALLGRALRDMPAWQLITLGMAAGIGEETLFRGVLQVWVEGLTSTWTSVAITGVFFGLLHAVTPLYFVLATVVSFYFGWLYVESGNLLVPILAHGLYDVIGFFVLRWKFRREEFPETGSDGGTAAGSQPQPQPQPEPESESEREPEPESEPEREPERDPDTT